MMILNALSEQVMNCLYSAQRDTSKKLTTERNVQTYVSVGMWLKVIDEYVKGTQFATIDYSGGQSRKEICGSRVTVIDKPGLWSFSIPKL